MILYFVCKVIRFFCYTCVVPFCCVTHRSHAIYTAVSRYVISFFETPLNFTISFVYIFSRGFKLRISSELDGFSHCPINMLKTCFVYGNNDALLEISSAHNFGACTNVSCF